MLKLYCQSCGGVNLYSAEKPNFCQKCGDSTNGTKKTKIKRTVAKEKKVEIEKPQEEATGRFESMTEIDFDLDFFKKEPDTFGSIAGTLEGASSDPILIPNKPKLTDEEIHSQFKKEAGSLRSPNKEQEKT